MKDIEEQMGRKEDMPRSHATTRPLDVAGFKLDISINETVRSITERQRKKLQSIINAAIGQPIPALSADRLTAIEPQVDMNKYVQ